MTDQPDQSDQPQAQARGPREEATLWIERVSEKILTPYGREKFADHAKALASAEDQVNTVTLVGEVGRGKSSLANALVGRQGVSPAGVDFTTVIPVALTTPTDDLAPGQAALMSADGGVVVKLEELAQRVDRAAQRFDDFVPTRAHVALESSMMGDAVVIDAPGVGGISSMNTAVHADTERQASVVVVVTDASSPLTKPEMDFLAHAHAVNGNVVVAVTKTDKHTTRWREIVEEDKALIATHLGEEIPVIGVSSLLPFVGLQTTDSVIDEISGLGELRTEINERFTRAQSIPVTKGLKVILEGLEDVDKQIHRDIEDVREAEKLLPDLTNDLARLEELQRTSKEWERFFYSDLSLMRTRAMERLDVDVQEVKKKWSDFISKHGVKLLRKDPQHFTRLMEEDFQRAVVNTVDSFGWEVETYLREKFGASHIPDEIIGDVQSQLSLGELHTSELQNYMKDTFDPMMLMMGLSSGSTIGGLLGAVLVPGVGIVAGAGFVAITFGYRAMRQGKSHLQNWLREAANAAQKNTGNALQTFIAIAQPRISIRYSEFLAEEIKATQARIKKIEHDKNKAAEKRDRELAQLNTNLKAVQRSYRDAEILLRKIAAQEMV
ncbi:dynamin family protein [Corynebacterium meitnerae]|uniref:Dynamin family protein n=1 Tax=Corynebacterium meitnerae TaxID=2913498 RepID=A0A9X3LUX8_9CORY|nr:dynamin family protein [Corynebacterium meitnerae]